MKAFALTFIFVMGIVAGIVWVDSTITFLLTVAVFSILAVAITYEPQGKSEAYYARQYREQRERRMRELHLNPKFSDRYDAFDAARPE